MSSDTSKAPALPSSEMVLEDGDILFREGQASDRVFQVLIGRIELTKQSIGGSIQLAVLGADEVFGEMGVIDNSVRSATARALGRVTLRYWDREAFFALLQERPDSTLALLRKVTQRLRQADESFSNPDGPPSASPTRALKRGLLRRSRRAFEQIRTDFLPDALEIEEQPIPLAARGILVTLLLFLVVGVIWASMAHLDRIVTAEGKLVTKAPRILVQSLDTMVVRSVDVQVGQVVKQGQILAHLDPTFADADASSSQSSLTSVAAQVARLKAIIGQGEAASFSEDAREDQQQRQIYENTLRERAAQLRSTDSEIDELKAHLQSIRQEQKAVQSELGILRELSGMRRELFDTRTGSRVTLLEAQRQLIVAERENDRLSNSLIETDYRLSSAIAKREGQVNEWRSKDMQELMGALREQAKLIEEVKKRERARTLVELTSPAHAVVLEVAPRTPGSVIRQADTLMSLIPLDGAIEAEVSVRPQDISHLRSGDGARIKLDSLPFQKHGTVDGRVTTISEDIFEEETAGHKVPTYRVRLTLDPSHLREIPKDFRLIPGMAVTAEVKIGTRSLISYFIYPIIRTLDSGLREP